MEISLNENRKNNKKTKKHTHTDKHPHEIYSIVVVSILFLLDKQKNRINGLQWVVVGSKAA